MSSTMLKTYHVREVGQPDRVQAVVFANSEAEARKLYIDYAGTVPVLLTQVFLEVK